MDIQDYDYYIVAFSGGKDSSATFLWLLEQGVDKSKIELWHHSVDGYNARPKFMDWECTESYCEKFAEAFGVPIYFSWKEGGFKREMLRNNQPTAPTHFFVPTIEFYLSMGKDVHVDINKFSDKYPLSKTVGGNGPNGTRKIFPQVTANLSQRWCSAYLKIDVCATAIRNQKRFNGEKVCILSGERGEESPGRAKYAEQEPDRSDNREGKSKRFVERLRPIKNWTEKMVWGIIEKYKVNVHPCYHIGWGRCSCKFCIFASADQISTGDLISAEQFEEIAEYEFQFGKTIKRNKSMWDLLKEGKDYVAAENDAMCIEATSYEYKLPILLEKWTLPAGAYGDSAGPT